MYRMLYMLLAASFAIAFAVMVAPPLLASGDIPGAFADGFVNPYASGYALDAIICWCVLAVWVVQEAKQHHVRHGWIALVLGIAPGVATGFAVYLLMRERQLKSMGTNSKNLGENK